MGEVARPSGLTKRKNSSNWYFRMRCPAHLLQQSPREAFWKSLDTGDYKLALTRVEAARAEAFRSFQPRPFGIVSSTARLRRSDDARLPLLRAEDAASFSIAFFHDQMLELDAQAPASWGDNAERDAAYQELEHREAILKSPNPDEGEEHPALGAETLLLQKKGMRAPMAEHPSRLLREYLRRALVQLVAIEKARFYGDFSVPITDPLFVSSGIAPSAATVAMRETGPVISVGDAAERFLCERIAGLDNAKTRDRYTREVAHIVSFFGCETPLFDIRRQQCVEFRDAFALLPPNFAKRREEGENLQHLLKRRKAGDPVLSWATHEKYLSALTRFVG